MFGQDSIGLLFTLYTKDVNATSGIKDLRATYEAETKRIKTTGTDAFLSLGQSVGLSGEKMAQLRTAVIPAVAAVTAAAGAAVGAGVAIFQLAKSTADLGSELHDLQQKTGLNAETISSLKVATDQSSSSIEEMSTGVVFLARTMADAERGVGAAQDKLARLGVTSGDLNIALGQTFKTIANAKSGVEQISLASVGFGKKLGANLIPTILSFNGDLDKLIETSRRLGATWTQADLEAADSFGDTLDTLGVQVRGVANEVGKNLIPFIDAKMKEGSKGLAENRQAWKEWGRGIADTIKGAEVIIESFVKNNPNVRVPLEILSAIGKYTTPEASGTPTGPPEKVGTRTVRGSGGNVYETDSPTVVSTAGGTGEDLESAKDRLQAVAAEQARIAQRQIDDANNKFKLNQISRAQDVEASIRANAAKLKADTDLLAAQIAVHQQELEEAKGDAEKREKISDQIEKLQEQIRDKRDAQERDAINRRAELRAQELADQQEHENARLQIFLQSSQNLIDAYNDRIKTGRLLAKEGNEAIEVIEKGMLDARKRSLEKQFELAGADNAARMKIVDGLQALEVEHTKLTQDQLRRRTEVVRSEIEKELQGRRDGNKRRADQRELEALSIQQAIDNGYKLESEGAEEIAKLRLKTIDDERKALEEELKLETTTLERRREIVRDQMALDTERARVAMEASDQVIRARIKEFNEGTAPINQSDPNLRGGPPGVPSVGPLGGLIDKDMGGELPPPPDTSAWEAVFGNLKKIGVDAFGSLTQGLTGMVTAMLAGSDKGKGAFASLAKAIVSSLAVQASVQALMEVAFAWKEHALAAADAAVFNFAGAAAHEAAAAAHTSAAIAFGLVGGGALAAAAVIGASGGGGAGAQSNAAGQAQTTGQGAQRGEPTPIEVNRRGEPQAIHVYFHNDVTVNEGHIVTTVVKDWHANGPIRLTVQTDGAPA